MLLNEIEMKNGWFITEKNITSSSGKKNMNKYSTVKTVHVVRQKNRSTL